MSAITAKEASATVIETVAHLQAVGIMGVTRTQRDTASKLATRLNSVLPLVQPGFADVPEKLRTWLTPRLNYTAPLKVLYDIDVDWKAKLFVVGEPDNGAYEWVLTKDDLSVTEFSNCGYGSSCIALRDALIAYHGLPEAR